MGFAGIGSGCNIFNSTVSLIRIQAVILNICPSCGSLKWGSKDCGPLLYLLITQVDNSGFHLIWHTRLPKQVAWHLWITSSITDSNSAGRMWFTGSRDRSRSARFSVAIWMCQEDWQEKQTMVWFLLFPLWSGLYGSLVCMWQSASIHTDWVTIVAYLVHT